MPEKIDSKIIRTRIKALRARMSKVIGPDGKKGSDICLITSDDWHQSECSGEFFAVREFFSGFDGSAGTLVVTKTDAALFTDGRYYLQAEKQLEGTGINLMKSGTVGTPTVSEYIGIVAGAVSHTAVVAFDGRTVSAELGEKLASYKNISIISDFDPAEDIWTKRPNFPSSEIFVLEEKYAGETVESKFSRIRDRMRRTGCDIHIIASLDDIAWILNLRGNDVPETPLFMSFLIIGNKSATLFTKLDKIKNNVKFYLEKHCLDIKDYDKMYSASRKEASVGVKILADKKRINFKLFEAITLPGGGIVPEIEFDTNPAVLMKSIKNETEIKNLIDVHIDDGLCLTRFMYWLKNSIADGKRITETEAAEYIDNLRRQVCDFYEFSFPTICAYGANAAMMHYNSVMNDEVVLEKGAMLLLDSGGQYFRGTTDVTRTFAIGEVSAEEKKAFTLTLKGMLALANARFLKGCSGYSLDILAREPLWKEGIDYRCGTGHGVGYMLNVHEPMNAFRWRYIPNVSEFVQIEPGMVTTDEPGVYVDGSFGIRIENELLCKKELENEYGTFLGFETLTLAPIDLDLVDINYLDDTDINRLNEYHQMVFDTLSPKLDGSELEFLRKCTHYIS